MPFYQVGFGTCLDVIDAPNKRAALKQWREERTPVGGGRIRDDEIVCRRMFVKDVEQLELLAGELTFDQRIIDVPDLAEYPESATRPD